MYGKIFKKYTNFTIRCSHFSHTNVWKNCQKVYKFYHSMNKFFPYNCIEKLPTSMIIFPYSVSFFSIYINVWKNFQEVY